MAISFALGGMWAKDALLSDEEHAMVNSKLLWKDFFKVEQMKTRKR